MTTVLDQFKANNETKWGDMAIEEAPKEPTYTPAKGKRGKDTTFAPKKMPKNVVVVGEPSNEGVAKKLSFEKEKVNLSNNPFAAFVDSDEE